MNCERIDGEGEGVELQKEKAERKDYSSFIVPPSSFYF
jgi:hypothetical protein